jgi:hypothetical protein
MSDKHPKTQSCQEEKRCTYLGAHGPTKVPTNKRLQTLLQQAAAISLITSHNQHSPPPANPSLSQRVFGRSQRFRVLIKVVELVMVMVPGSVKDERMFSMLKYVRNPRRNRLMHSTLSAAHKGLRAQHSA